MSVVAELSLRAEEFPLGRTLAEFPDVSVEMEQLVPAGERVLPYVWGCGPGLDEFVAAAEGNPNVRSITVLDRLDDRGLFRVVWGDPATELVDGLVETGATILEARGDEEWTVRIRFADRSGLAQFNRYCETHDLDYSLQWVRTLGETPVANGGHDLTEPQAEALGLAVERGYFEIPRGVTFDELADELGVSVQAISERVRRGADKILRAELLEGPNADP